MCGIAGWVTLRPARCDHVEPVAVAMRDTLVHRGPDDAGLWSDIPADVDRRGACVLAFRRLSIIDLQQGHQPMGNEDGQVQVVFNGEIYNHRALRRELEAAGHRFACHADTEVLVHGWEQWGTGLLARCNGMFDLAIWDSRQRTLLLARDRFGKKPLFVGVADGGQTLVFGSELDAVRAHPAIADDLDPFGLAGLLTLDAVPSPRSILRDVHTLQPGQFWLWQARDGEAVLTQGLWHAPQLPDGELMQLSEGQALVELDRRLRAAVERRLMADVPLGIFLSGGIDSSLVSWYAAQLRPPAQLDTFAIAFDDPSFDESSHARAVARHLGTRHHERLLTAEACLALVPQLLARLDQPLADPSLLPTAFLCAFAREHVTVALGGDGGDEWFMGYPTFAADRLARAWDAMGLGVLQPAAQALVGWLPTSHRNWSLDQQAKRFVRGLAEPPAARHFAWICGMPWREATALLHPDLRAQLTSSMQGSGPARPDPLTALDESWRAWCAASRGPEEALAGHYARWYLADGVLQKVDRASMGCGLEARAPLLDPEVVALARAMPLRLKLRGRTTKWALRRLASDKLPRAIVERPKKGFGVPLAAWLRGPLRAWLTDLLQGQGLRQSGWVDGAAVDRLLSEHLSGRRDHRKPLWALAGLAAWQLRGRPRSAA